MPQIADQLYWNRVDERKKLIALQFDAATKHLNDFKAKAELLKTLNIASQNIENLITEIESTKKNILENINVQKAQLMSSGASFTSARSCEEKLCSDAEKFAQQLELTIALATNEEMLKDPESSISAEFDRLQSTAKADFLSPKTVNLLKNIALALILPIVFFSIWALAMPSMFTGGAVLIPIVVVATFAFAAGMYAGYQDGKVAAQFATDQRDTRLGLTNKLGSTLFAPINKHKQDVIQSTPSLRNRYQGD